MSASAGVYHSLIIAQFGTRKYTQKQVKHFYFSKKNTIVSCELFFTLQTAAAGLIFVFSSSDLAEIGTM
jgi:hypothetical protein